MDPAPRVGFALKLTQDGRTSLHGGYGIGYTRVPFRITDAFGSNPPGVQSANFISGTLGNPAAGSSADTAVRPQGLTVVNTDFRASQVQSFSLIFQREVIRSGIFAVGYAGSLGRHLRADTDQNQVLPTTTSYSPSCLASGQAPSARYDFDPCLNTGIVSSDYLRPYKGYGSLNEYIYGASSNYHSLQSQFRLQRGPVQTTLNYTYSKAMGDANGGSGYRTSYSGTQNSYNLALSTAPPTTTARISSPAM